MNRCFPVIFLVFFLTAGFSQKRLSTKDTSVAKVFDLLYNKPFAALSLEDTSGHLFNTSSMTGKTIYVDFWFTNCPPCIREIPFSNSLQRFFVTDTNIVFLSICIDNIEKKPAWKQMIKVNEMSGVHLFYARNRPQKSSLVKEYLVNFPTYLVVNKEMKVIGYNAPRPSEEGWVHWAIIEAKKNNKLSVAYYKLLDQTKTYREFINSSWPVIVSLRKNK